MPETGWRRGHGTTLDQIERIEVAIGGISITLHVAGIRSLVTELASGSAEPEEGAMMDAADL